jgi:hypothetical protein
MTTRILISRPSPWHGNDERNIVLLSSFENETKQNFKNSASSSSREQTNINIRQDRAREVNIFGFPLAPDDQDTKIT